MRRMRLFLSSHLLGDDASFLQRARGAERGRALVVFNAQDGAQERLARQEFWTQELAKLGYASEELDLRDHFDADPAGDRLPLHERLDAADLVWVVGGNSFVLARAMRQARFSMALARPLREGRIIYGGCSAGACVTGPDLQGLDRMDDPGVVPEGYDPEVEPAALGLVPFRIVPHWKSEHAESEAAERVVAWMTKRKLDHRALRDGEVVTFG